MLKIEKDHLSHKWSFSRREEGIRTLDTLLGYTRFPGELLQPLGHLSVFDPLRKIAPLKIGLQRN